MAMNNVIIKPTSQFEVRPHENKYLKGTISTGRDLGIYELSVSVSPEDPSPQR